MAVPLELDSETDIGAMVYRPGDEPDRLLERFLTRVLGEGYDGVGVLQRRLGDGRVDFFLVPHEDTIMGRDRAPAAANCAEGVRTIGARLSEVLRRRRDLLVVNRFGTLEAAGAGLTGVIAEAIAAEVPVLVAVPEGLFPRWLSVAEGLAVKLRPMDESLDAWWRSLARPLPSAGPNFCERYK